MKSWKAWLLVAVIFATGVLAGAFGMRSYMAKNLPLLVENSRKRMEEHFLETIDHEVGLTEKQKETILPILREAVEKGEVIHQSVRGKFDNLMNATDDRIAGELDEQQRVKFAAFRKRMEEWRRRGPGPGGPEVGGPGPGGPGGFPPGPPPGPPPQ
jgi:hypothetical protein